MDLAPVALCQWARHVVREPHWEPIIDHAGIQEEI